MTSPDVETDYTDRSIEEVVIDKVHDDGRTVTWTNGWSFGGIPAEHGERLHEGAEFLFETVRFSTVTGMATMYRTRAGEPVVDEWLWHKTDATLKREHAEMVARFAVERKALLRANQDDWLRREALLPLSLRRRLDRFHANGGHEFKASGWGYELTVCELAVLYAATEQQESQAVDEYAREHGTSGNQHDYAKVLSRHLTNDPADEDIVANSVSALSPITGDTDYSGISSPPASALMTSPDVEIARPEMCACNAWPGQHVRTPKIGCPDGSLREEAVEWGMTDSGSLGVPRTGMTESQARNWLEHDYQHGYSQARLRRRTVITITGPWEYVPNSEMDGRDQVVPPASSSPEEGR